MGVKTPTLLDARDSGLTLFAVEQFSPLTQFMFQM